MDIQQLRDAYCDILPIGGIFPVTDALVYIGIAVALGTLIAVRCTGTIVACLAPVGLGALLSIAVLLECQ